MAGCPSGWTYDSPCGEKEDCTSNTCSTNSNRKQKVIHYHHRCKTTVNGISYTDCFYATSNHSGCC